MSKLSLEFSTSLNGKTYLKKQYASYPFHICKVQYLENDPRGMANIYIQSASGGIYEDESLVTNVVAGSNSYSHITTQASTIVHGMPNGTAFQSVDITVTDNSYTEYMSDPLILFPESKFSSRINVFTDDTSTAVLADAFLLHFLGNHKQVFKMLNTSLQVYTEDNELLAKDVYWMSPENFLNEKRGYIGMGTVFVINRSNSYQDLFESLQHCLQQSKDVYGGVSHLPNKCGLIIKFLAHDGDDIKKTVQQIWMATRTSIVGIRPNIRKK